ncbi:MAG: VOC family protein [Patescibacteria group bacterium]
MLINLTSFNMNYNPVGWFEIPVTDLDRATKFYEILLGIKLRRQDVPGYEMVWFPRDENVKGISGALMKGDGYHPGDKGPVIYFTCPDIEVGLQRAEAAGGKIKLHKKDIGEAGCIGWLWDSEGNIIALHTVKTK